MSDSLGYLISALLALGCLFLLEGALWLVLGRAARSRTRFLNRLRDQFGGTIEWKFHVRSGRAEGRSLRFTFPTERGDLEFVVEFRTSEISSGSTRIQMTAAWPLPPAQGEQALREMGEGLPLHRQPSLRADLRSASIEFPGDLGLSDLHRTRQAIVLLRLMSMADVGLESSRS